MSPDSMIIAQRGNPGTLGSKGRPSEPAICLATSLSPTSLHSRVRTRVRKGEFCSHASCCFASRGHRVKSKSYHHCSGAKHMPAQRRTASAESTVESIPIVQKVTNDTP